MTVAVGHPRCGAKKRQGPGLCGQTAGWGTDHPRKGRCKLHGGSTPIKHGRYSKVSDVRLASLIAELEADPVPLDVLQELVVARALIADFLERYVELRDALLRWNAAQDEHERPARLPNVTDVRPLLETVSRMVYRIERSQSDKYIPRAQLLRLMQAMGRAVDSIVTEEVARVIHEDWMGIELP